MCKFFGLSLLVAAWAGVSTHAALVNVALNKPVTTYGTIYGVSGATVVDGKFLAEATAWYDNTKYWEGTAPYLDIDLQGAFTIVGFMAQADNNDTYRIQYLGVDNLWHLAWDIPKQPNGWGLATRPDIHHVNIYELATPITATALRFSATGGDTYYSVSEVQAFAVPEPAPYFAGLGLLGILTLAARKTLQS